MFRRILGSILVVLGTAGVVASPYEHWYQGRVGTDYKFFDLFGDITLTKTHVFASLALPMFFLGALALIAVVAGSRWMAGFAGLAVVVVTVLWGIQQERYSSGLVIDNHGRGLQQGVVNALGGGLLVLLGAFVMPGRRKKREAPAAAAPAPATAAPATAAPTDVPLSTTVPPELFTDLPASQPAPAPPQQPLPPTP